MSFPVSIQPGDMTRPWSLLAQECITLYSDSAWDEIFFREGAKADGKRAGWRLYLREMMGCE